MRMKQQNIYRRNRKCNTYNNLRGNLGDPKTLEKKMNKCYEEKEDNELQLQKRHWTIEPPLRCIQLCPQTIWVYKRLNIQTSFKSFIWVCIYYRIYRRVTVWLHSSSLRRRRRRQHEEKNQTQRRSKGNKNIQKLATSFTKEQINKWTKKFKFLFQSLCLFNLCWLATLAVCPITKQRVKWNKINT